MSDKVGKTNRIRDVAARAGVSSATVSRVLAGKPHVSAAVRERVLEAAQTLRYRPNRIARSLRVQRSRFVGLVVSDIQNPFFNRVVRAVEDAVLPHGYAVFLCNTDENPEREALYLELFLDEQVAGIILTPTHADAAAYSGFDFGGAGVPLVVIDRPVAGLAVDTVVSDNLEASRAVVAQLIARGHTRIGAVLSELSISTGRLRLEGYEQALAGSGLESEAVFGKPVEAEGYRLAAALMERAEPPTALFTGSKLLTLGVLRYLFEHRIRVSASGVGRPGVVALAAFDDLDWLPETPEMLNVTQPAYDIGAQAAALLLARIGEPLGSPVLRVLPSSVAWIGGRIDGNGVSGSGMEPSGVRVSGVKVSDIKVSGTEVPD